MRDAARIAELLEVLRAAKVARFEDGAIKVEFDPRAFDPPLPPPRDDDAKPERDPLFDSDED